MFNKTIQEVDVIPFHKEVIETYQNPVEENRDMEIEMFVTPSKNYFKALTYNNCKNMFFENLKDAREYILTIDYNEAIKKDDNDIF